MNPDLEFFLQNAFTGIEPLSAQVGRVVVEPDYNRSFTPEDASPLRDELTEFLGSQKPTEKDLRSYDGFETKIGTNYSLLQKYVRRISLHADAADGDWIEVMPPGNWI